MEATMMSGRAERVARTWRRRMLFLLTLISVICAGLAVTSFALLGQADELNRRHALAMASGGTLVARLQDTARAAVAGDPEAFESLRLDRDRFQSGLASLGGRQTDGAVGRSGQVGDVERIWRLFKSGIDRILADQEALRAANARVQAAEVLFLQLGEMNERLAAALVASGAPPELILRIGRQPLYLERMQAALGRFGEGGPAAARAIENYGASAGDFVETLRALDVQPVRAADRAALDEALALSSILESAAAELTTWMRTALPAIDALPELRLQGERLDAALTALAMAYRDAPRQFDLAGFAIGAGAVPLLGAAALLGLALLALITLRESRRREERSQAQIDRDERAILRLLDEMGSLADGDLTVEATVTEDKTGAIADAVNYAVEALRILVTTINDTASQVTRAAQVSRGISLRLAGASRVQAQRIAQASGAIGSLTSQIDEVAKNAGESAEVASRAVEVAGRGAQAVRDTIVGMDGIRGQIQETARRMKRLGESSQEIGEIVELIDDIADQTNILALNAAMQAAMAGDAGRGFAVVADEVQRLAERSRHATRQIEALVRAIQADTSEAIGSMETSTANVVGGARLAERAGDALREIENVSNYIADLTRRIADSAERQSRQSAEINETVQAIRAITEENNDGTRRAAESVEELANLAVELQRSVTGFRLPT